MPALPATQILLYEGLDELDAVGPHEVLAAAGFPVRTVTSGSQPEFVTGNHGLRLGVDGSLDEGAGGLLVVPGGGYVAPGGAVRRELAAGAIPAAIARTHAAGTVIAAVCTGGLLVAAAGLLAGRPAVTHRAALEGLGRFGAEVQAGARVVDDGDVLTAGGVTSGIDLALHLVERFAGADAAERGAIRLEHDRRPHAFSA